jgi:hypothetical protein
MLSEDTNVCCSKNLYCFNTKHTRKQFRSREQYYITINQKNHWYTIYDYCVILSDIYNAIQASRFTTVVSTKLKINNVFNLHIFPNNLA